MEKVNHGLPVPFVVNENNQSVFLTKIQEVQHFSFSKRVQKQMGLNYFEISDVKTLNSLLCKTKEGAVMKCSLLSTKIGQSDNYCFTAISNN